MIRCSRIDSALLLVVALAITGCAKPVVPTADSPQPTTAITEPEEQTPAKAFAASDSTTPTETAEPTTAATSASVPAVAERPAAAFYSVAAYDENQNPTADLATTIQRATAENKRILLQVGGEWCGWCHRISDYMETNEKVRKLIDDHFIVMKVTYPAAHVESFLEPYPRVEAYPHLFVLEPDGQFLHSQGTAELEFEKSYNEEVFCKFLNDWVL